MYYEMTEANMNFAQVGRSIGKQLLYFGIEKVGELVRGKLDKTGTCITITNPKLGSTQLMYHLVDNSKSYGEFAKNRSRYDIDFHVSLDRNNSCSSNFSNIVKTIFFNK